MRVVVVGAGAVGQVYGRHLQLGGADVTFLVRDKYRAEAAAGFELYPLNRRDKTVPVRFDGFGVATDPRELAQPVDQVWLGVSSPALGGAWLRAPAAATPDATYVVLQPGLDDRLVVERAGVAAERIVAGMISLISYHAPLPGETRFAKPGMAYWFPPRAPSLFSGPRADAVVAALRAGKQPAKRHRDAAQAAMFPSAIMMPYLVALEASGWSTRALLQGPLAHLAARAAREAMGVVGAAHSTRVPLLSRLAARKTILRTGLWFARKIIPLPLDIYLEQHFTKVGDQTREMMARYIALGADADQPVDALRELIASPALGESGSVAISEG